MRRPSGPTLTGWIGGVGLGALVLVDGCRCQEPAPAPAQRWKAALGGEQQAPAGRPAPATLLLSMAQFEHTEDASGKPVVKPGPAKLLLLRHTRDGWRAETIEDPESRVFHKASCVADRRGRMGILTIGGTKALLKHWRRVEGRWQSSTLWSTAFGGKWDRLRDYELGDVDGDGRDELVIGTHDQGVIAVLQPDEEGWPVQEIYRRPDTFIHEIEIGDGDGDRKKEIFATPSRPNKAGVSQSGGVLALRFSPETKSYQSEWVTQLERRHAKELLVADVDGDGREAVYVAVEAQLARERVTRPVEVLRFTPVQDGGWRAEQVAELPGGIQARVLLRADLDGDRNHELVVTTMKGGIWRLLPPKGGSERWRKELVDRDSSGFEHAATAADLDGDGRAELYVVADDQDRVSRYVWRDGTFARETIHALPEDDLTWNIVACSESL